MAAGTDEADRLRQTRRNPWVAAVCALFYLAAGAAIAFALHARIPGEVFLLPLLAAIAAATAHSGATGGLVVTLCAAAITWFGFFGDNPLLDPATDLPFVVFLVFAAAAALIWLAVSVADMRMRRVRQVDAELHLSASAFHNAGSAIVVFEPTGRILSVNPALTRLIETSADLVVGRHIADIQGHDGGWDFEARLAAIGRTGECIFDADLPTGSGGMVTALMHVSVVASAEGRALYYVATLHDVTSRAAEETSLRIAERRLGITQGIGAISGWECDIATGAMSWSGNQERQFGLSADTAPDLDRLLDHIHPDDREGLQHDLDTLIIERRDLVRDLRITRPGDGAEIWLAVRGEVLRDREGQAVTVAGILYDITALKSAETRERLLRELADRLALARDTDTAANAAVQVLGDHLNAGRIVFREIDREKDAAKAVYRYTLGDPGAWPSLEPGDWRYRQFAIDGGDGGAGPALAEAARNEGVAAILAVACPPGRSARAMVEVHCTSPTNWEAQTIKLIEQVGERLLAAIDRLRARHTMAAQAARLTGAFDHWDEGFAILRVIRNEDAAPEFVWEYSNRAIAALAGVERLAGLRLSEAGIEPGGQARYTAFLASGATHERHVVRRQRPSQGRVEVETVAIEEGIAFFTRDVTDREIEHDHLEQEERRLRALVATQVAFVWHASDAGAMQSPEAWGAFTGQPAEAAEGFGWLSAAHPDDRPGLLAAWTAALRTGERLDHSLRLQHHEDGYRAVDIRAVPVRRADGSIAEWVGSVADRDAERQAARNLSSAHERLETAIHAAAAAFWKLDRVRDRIEADPALAGLYGLDTLPERAETLLAAIHPDDRDLVAAAERRAAEGDGSFEREYRILTPAGEVRWLSERGRVETTREGAVATITGISFDVTRRREAEEARRANIERMRRANEAGQIGAWDWDLARNALSWSSGFRRIFGMSDSTPTSYEALLSFVHPEDRGRADRELLEAIRTADTYASEFRILAPGDTGRWIQMRGAVVRDPSGNAAGLMGVCLDISERKRIEHELRRINAELQGVVERRTRERDGFFELSQDLFAVVGFDGYLKHVNYAWEATLGYSQSRLLSRPFLVFMHREDRARARAALASLQAGENLPRLDVRGRRIDGEYRWFSITAVPADGNFYVVARDITAERQARMALRAANARLTAEMNERERTAGELLRAQEGLALALEAARMGTFDCDIATGLVRRSARHDELFGLREPLAVWTMEQTRTRILEEDAGLFRDGFRRALETGLLDAEWRVRWPDGSVHWIAAWGRTFYDDEERPQRVAGVLLDTTDRRQTEAELRQAQKMEAVGQLTGGIAHDFNNLLTVVSGNLDLIIRGSKEPERVARLAKSAETAAKRGARLIDQLLAFGRRQSLRPEILDLDALMRDFSGLLHRAVGETIEVSYEGGEDLWPVHVDSGQLESAILNLAVNARDAMPDGGRLTIEACNVTVEDDESGYRGGEIAAGGYVLIRVTDTGQGMSPDVLERVFEPFFTTKGVGRGTGLGLSQVYGFVRQSGGAINIESAPGTGTTIEIHLPRGDASAAGTPRPQGQAGDEPERGGETILVVEDDDDVRHVTVETLNDLGYRVLVAHDGVEARRILAGSEPIDLLFTDIVMPNGVTGTMLARETMSARPEIAILLTSGYSADEHFDEGDPVAELPLLRKPFRTQDLSRALRSALESAPAHSHGVPRLNVLVVEDDALVRLAAVDMLQSLGHVPIEAADAAAALALVEAGEGFDLLMADIGLPDMDGTELAARLRDMRPDLPVIFASGYDELAFEAEGRGTRTAFLGKPFTTGALSASIQTALAAVAVETGADRPDAAA